MKPKSLARQSDCPRLVAAVCALWFTGLALQAATTESNLEKTFSVKPGGLLFMNVDRGSISINTADRTDVVIEVKRRISGVSAATAQDALAAHEVTFDQEGDRVQVQAKFKPGFRASSNRAAQKLQVEYRVLAPKQFNLDLLTSAGDISSTDLEGNAKVKTAAGGLKFESIKGNFDGLTSAGDINLTAATGPVAVKTSGGSIHLGQVDADTRAETSAGEITVKAAKAKLNAKTSGGEIHLGQLEGPTEAQTSAGAIRVKVAQATLAAKTSGGEIKIEEARDTVRAETSAGSIEANFSAQPQSDCRLVTSGGSIVVKLDPELGFELDARTSAGEVRTELPVTTTVIGKQGSGQLRGKLNGGGKALVLKTSAGDISIRKR
jgi:DUF4097 and DUF4098 domain-containing protein YvlB